MQVISHPNQVVTALRKVCLAIGMFDGVHLGHQQVIRQTIDDARQHEAAAVAVTFDRHPNTIVNPGKVPPLIYSLPQKLRAIDSLGADIILLIAFDALFSEQSGEDFIRQLAQGFGHVHSICVGSAFAFGHKRTGNVQLLTRLGRQLGFLVHGSASVALDGEVVSSTRIRQAIQNGSLSTASQMLGRAYSLSGKIIEGAHRGRELGFPTANLDSQGLALPPVGVYAAHALVKTRQYRAVINVGYRPTVAVPKPVSDINVEAHLLDFSGELYGQEMEITFVERLRDERKFSDLDALKHQITLDIQAARLLFA